jgi:radical SAM superfamily enzyme with C-terminal helix-hairpin-helix motif
MKALVLDGYTDEPACLGVPPFISPYARLAYGALSAARAEIRYATIDQYRAGGLDTSGFNLLAVIRNLAVPGKYLRGMPASDKELLEIAGRFKGARALSLGVVPAKAPLILRQSYDHISCADLDASLFELVKTKEWVDRRRTATEWNSWLMRGAEACASHPDYGGPLIAEVQMYRGCVRYVTGGCRFCVEPLLGGVEFREPRDILAEVVELSRLGVRNFRLGAQSCVYCYMSKEVGKNDNPRPNVEAISGLLRAVRDTVKPEVFHLDNANPAVIAEHPEESREITKAIAEHCTSGNVLAFGLESADPKVGRANNLNATPEQTLKAIELVNDIGSTRGPSGLPLVLPGLNFVCGLDGETNETYDLNLRFLRDVLEKGLQLRRVNIRQVVPSRSEFPGIVSKSAFAAFKRKVREEIDAPMLDRIVPDRTILSGVYPEVREGGRTFGRQVGTYPLLVSFPYPVELGKKVDVAVTGRGFRSVTGIIHPTDVNSATMSMLQAIPGIGRKRAMSIIRRRPFTDPGLLWELFDEPSSLQSAQFHLTTCNVVKE